jgi:hypothetical protein
MLGIHISERIKDPVKENFDLKRAKIDQILLLWKGKALSLYGRVTLVNTLIVSTVSLPVTSIPR